MLVVAVYLVALYLLVRYARYVYAKRSDRTAGVPVNAQKGKSGYGEAAAAIGVAILYSYFGLMSSMLPGSCSDNCPITAWLMAGNVWLIISCLFFWYALSLKDVSKKKPWLIIFYPYIALPIFFGLIAIGAKLSL